MILSRLLKPKWQHPDPRVRKRALEKLSERDDDERGLLERFAAQDDEPDLRRAALKRLSNLALLRERSEIDSDAGVREVASARYRQLLAGGMEEVGLDIRLKEVKSCESLSVLSHLARRGRELELRVAALERLPSGSVVEDAAINDPAPRVRQFAAARLSDQDALERVKRASRDKDRKVYRLAQDALKALREAEETGKRRRAEWSKLCEEAEALAQDDWRASLSAEIARLDNRWQAVGEMPPEPLRSRFSAAMDACRALAKAEPQPAEPSPTENGAASQDKRGAFAGHSAVPESAAGRSGDLEALEALWRRVEAEVDVEPALLEEIGAALGSIESGSVPRPDRLEALVDRLEQYRAAATRYLSLRRALLGAEARAQRTLAEERADPRPAAERLASLIKDIGWPSDRDPPSALGQAEQTARAVQACIEERAAQWRSLVADLDEAMDRLATAREAGSLKEARKLISRAEGIAGRLPDKVLGSRARHLRRLEAQVNELRDWRRFATLPKQTELCERMEALADTPPSDPPDRAKAIKALQEEWRATGGSDSPQSQQLWRRFSLAADNAFEPCREYFAEQALRRRENLAERERICTQLESFVSAADWQRIAVDALETIVHQARREWRIHSPVDNRPGRPLQDRFDRVMDTLSARLAVRQDEYRVVKQGLVERAQAAADIEDISQAVRLVKSLQQEWRQSSSARPGDERRLRKAFKKACDAVFQRRELLRKEAEDAREGHRAEADRLCQGLESLLDVADENFVREAPAALSQARQEFRDLGSLPRDSDGGIRMRFRAASQAVETRLEGIARSRRRGELDVLARRAELCARLERAVAEGLDASDLEALQGEWRHGPALRPEWQAALAERWRRAEQAASEVPFSEDELAESSLARRRLCVRMEILAGVESPSEDEQLRMALQVERLTQGMSDGVRQTPLEAASQLEVSWHLSSALGMDEATELQTRFDRARAALEGLR